MIAMLKRLYKSLAAHFWRNPLVRYRYERGTAFTWENLFLAALVLLFVYASCVRVWYGLLAMDALSLLPAEARAAEADYIRVQYWPSIATFYPKWNIEPTDSEMSAITLQILALIGFGFLYAYRAVRVSIRRKKSWTHPLRDELVLIPATPGQRLVGLVEWQLWKIAGAWLFCILLLLLPMRSSDIFRPNKGAHDFAPHTNLVIIFLSLGLFVFLFSCQRMTLAFFLGKKRIWKSIASAGLPLSFFIAAIAGFALEMEGVEAVLEAFEAMCEYTPLTTTTVFLAGMLGPGWRALRAGREMLVEEDG